MNIEEEVLKDPVSYLKGFLDGQEDARRFVCRWCGRRIDWYPTYRNWLTSRPSHGRRVTWVARSTCELDPSDNRRHDPDLGKKVRNGINK